jgi:hypothetical protein
LPNTTLISVGHRSSLAAFHDRRLELRGDARWPAKLLNCVEHQRYCHSTEPVKVTADVRIFSDRGALVLDATELPMH